MRCLRQQKLFCCLAIGISLLFHVSVKAQRVVNPDDPYESFNRSVFNFNDGLDRAVLKPTANLYQKIVPKPLVKGIHNFFNNLGNITTVCDDILQGNFYQATSDTWRLGINSTLGIGGFFDVATPMGLEKNYEDFGLTLAQWGYTKSNFLVVPFFGPSTVRDVISWPVDYYAFSVYPYIYPKTTRYGIYAVSVVDSRVQLLQYQNLLAEVAVDKYAFMRSAYLQRRAYQIARNKELGNPYLEKNMDGGTEGGAVARAENTIAKVNTNVVIKP